MGMPESVLSPELCRTFAVLIRLGGSVSGAARELGVSVATVSKRLRPLVFGSPPSVPRPWLQKQGRRFSPTEEGRRMLPLAQEQARAWEAFEATAAADPDTGLTIACGSEAAGGIVLAAAEQFRREHPTVPLRVAVKRGRQRIEGVASGRYDVALVTESAARVREVAGRAVVVEELAEDELVAACAYRSPWSSHFADAEQPLGAETIIAWPLVLPEADSAIRQQWDEFVRRKEPTTPQNVAIEVGGWRVLLGYVQAGFGVGLVPLSLASSANPKVRYRRLAAGIRPANKVQAVRLSVVTGERGRLAQAFVAMLKAIRAA